MTKNEIEVVPFGAFRELMEHPGPVSSGLSCACDDYGVTLGAPHLFRSVFGRSHYVRMDCMRMGIVKEGFCSLMVNGKTYRCQPGDLIYINWGGVLGPDIFARGVVFEGMATREDYLRTLFSGDVPLLLSDANFHFRLSLNPVEREALGQYLHTLYLLTGDPQTSASCAQLIGSLLRYVELLYRRHTPGQTNAATGDSLCLLDRFLSLVDRHVAREHKLAFYASELCTTPTYLDTRIMQISGETPKEWIDRALSLKAKTALRCSAAPIKTIVNDLGFPSSSAFCKFFKRTTGTTPMAYRRSSRLSQQSPEPR